MRCAINESTMIIKQLQFVAGIHRVPVLTRGRIAGFLLLGVRHRNARDIHSRIILIRLCVPSRRQTHRDMMLVRERASTTLVGDRVYFSHGRNLPSLLKFSASRTLGRSDSDSYEAIISDPSSLSDLPAQCSTRFE